MLALESMFGLHGLALRPAQPQHRLAGLQIHAQSGNPRLVLSSKQTSYSRPLLPTTRLPSLRSFAAIQRHMSTMTLLRVAPSVEHHTSMSRRAEQRVVSDSPSARHPCAETFQRTSTTTETAGSNRPTCARHDPLAGSGVAVCRVWVGGSCFSLARYGRARLVWLLRIETMSWSSSSPPVRQETTCGTMLTLQIHVG